MERADILIVILGNICFENFSAIILLCLHAFGDDAFSLVRGMYGLLSCHFHLHPDDVQAFWEFHLVKLCKLGLDDVLNKLDPSGNALDDLSLYRGPKFIGVVRFPSLEWKRTTRFFSIRLKPVRYGDHLLALGRAKRRGVEWTAAAIIEAPGVERLKCESSGALKTILTVGTFPKS